MPCFSTSSFSPFGPTLSANDVPTKDTIIDIDAIIAVMAIIAKNLCIIKISMTIIFKKVALKETAKILEQNIQFLCHVVNFLTDHTKSKSK